MVNDKIKLNQTRNLIHTKLTIKGEMKNVRDEDLKSKLEWGEPYRFNNKKVTVQ